MKPVYSENSQIRKIMIQTKSTADWPLVLIRCCRKEVVLFGKFSNSENYDSDNV